MNPQIYTLIIIAQVLCAVLTMLVLIWEMLVFGRIVRQVRNEAPSAQRAPTAVSAAWSDIDDETVAVIAAAVAAVTGRAASDLHIRSISPVIGGGRAWNYVARK